jgi:ADP-heptose:LPS heptosyltransferase
LAVTKENKTKLGLPNKFLINKIKKYKFDLIIDLNLEYDIFSLVLSTIPEANFRVGFVKKNSDYFYNYQIPQEINSEKSYRNLLNSLRMF